MEVYNDYNSNLTNLFFCVKERPLALITELGFLPLNSRDDYDAISRQLKCEEFDDEYLAIELELADKYFSPLHAKAIKALLLKRAQRGNVRRAANYYKVIRYSFSGAGKSFGGKPCNIRNFFTDIWRCSRRLENVVVENKDFESLLAQYDPFWAYARATMRDGTMLWGFVPLMAVQLNDAVDAAAMASVCGTWGFCGGGELMGWVFTLMADGEGVCYAISDEASESMRYLTEGITADMNPESAGMFQWQIVGGTNGYAHDFILSNTSKAKSIRLVHRVVHTHKLRIITIVI